MKMMIDYKTAAELMKSKDKILILIHQFPDGDTIGSGYALCRCLQSMGKQARVECNHKTAPKFDYIVASAESRRFEPEYIVAVDVADEKLLGDKMQKYCGKIDLCIDHHASNTGYAEHTCVDAKCSAACELIYDVILSLGGEIDVETAAALYTGIATDTGCFKFTNTTAKTHIIAAKLMEKGIDYGEINRVMFDTKSKSRVMVERMALERMIFTCGDKCALTVITADMRRKSGASDDELDGITSLPRQIEGVVIGITVRERENNLCKVSVRTHEPISASDFCAAFGGGGHVRAGGCTIEADVDTAAEMLLAHAEKTLKEFNL